MMAVEITEEFVWQNIPRRPRDSHKGTFGSVHCWPQRAHCAPGRAS